MSKVIMRSVSILSRIASEEIRIPVPWGHVAGKWWGPRDKRPILSLHGWQDNCGTYDTLIPLLPDQFAFLAIDTPGHGRSSPLPLGMFYHQLDMAMLLRHLQNYFNWSKISLMGHSLGAITTFQFAGFYPYHVDFIICLDGLSTPMNPMGIHEAIKNIDNFLKYNAQETAANNSPSYHFDEMIEAMHTAHRGSIDKDKCKYILERNIIPTPGQPGKFKFIRDARIKTGQLMNWALKDIIDHAKRVRMPMLYCRAENTVYEWKEYGYEHVRGILAEVNPLYEFHLVPGRHHGHLNQPELYADILSAFLFKYATKDRDMDGQHFERIGVGETSLDYGKS